MGEPKDAINATCKAPHACDSHAGQTVALGKPSAHDLSRRQLLRIGLTATSFLAGGLQSILPTPAFAQSDTHSRCSIGGPHAGQQALHVGQTDRSRAGPRRAQATHRGEAGAVCRGAILCRFARTGRTRVRSEHWAHLCDQGCRKLDHARNHRQPGIWRCGFGNKGDSGDGALQLWSSQGDHPRQGSTRTDQCIVSAYPTSRQSSGFGSRIRH